MFSWSLCAFNVKSFCLRPVLEAQLAVFRGPPLAPSSVLLPAPVGKQIAPPPNTGSGAALCCGRAGRCPSGCRSQMLQTGRVGGRVVPPPSTSVRGCVPARKAGGRSRSTCAAGSSALCAAAAPPWSALRRWARERPRDSPVPAPSQNPAPCLSLWSKFSEGPGWKDPICPGLQASLSLAFEAAKPFGADAGFAPAPA